MISIFKNESHVMREWVNHYLTQGVDKIFLLDNGSTDNYFEEISNYIKNNRIELIYDAERYSQEKLYNKHFLEKSKIYDWVIVCDLDEFIYSRKQYKTIKEYLKTVPSKCSQIFIPWKLFGSNGYNTLDNNQPQSVIKSFTKRINYDKEENFQGVIKEDNNKYSMTKCIVRTKNLIQFKIHSHETDNTHYITTDNNHSDIHQNNQFSKINEEILEDSFLHLNHYAIQSFQWFMNIKSTRGDNYAEDRNSIRDENYFKAFDNSSNDIDDFELYNISKMNKLSDIGEN